MNTTYKTTRFSAFLIATLMLGGLLTADAMGQGRRAVKNHVKNKVKGKVQNRAANIGRAKAKNIYRNHGKAIVKQKAIQNGITKQQVLNNQGRVKNQLKNTITNRVKNRTKNIVQNHGKAYARNKIQQYGPRKFKQHVKGKVQNHIKNRAQWNWHGRPYTKATWRTLKNRVCHLRQHRHLCWDRVKWCNYYPTRCHWWYNFCSSNFYFDPTCTVTYDWTYYQVPATLVTQVAQPNVRWNLGMSCVLIPGRGLGVESVAAGSPAELAGIQPGMIISIANGIAITDEISMPTAIDQSSGLLNLEVFISETEIAQMTVQMQPLIVADF